MTNFNRRIGSLLALTLLASAGVTQNARAGESSVYSDSGLSCWSSQQITETISGRRFRGPFHNEPVSLKLEHLPAHEWVRVRFKLYIMGTWDGSNPVWGPDLWSLSVRGGPRLIFASFCGWGYAGNDEQSYPDTYPIATYHAWNGAAERGVLGWDESDPPKNGVYNIDVVFPHSQPQLTLDFAGIYEDPEPEQKWGIGDVETITMTEPPTLDASVLPQLWEDLASEDSGKANTALWRFVGAGEKAVDFTREKVKDLPSTVSGFEGLRLHRAHRAVRIIGGPTTSGLCFQMEQHFPEYAQKYGR